MIKLGVCVCVYIYYYSTQNGESIASALQVRQIISTRDLHVSSLVGIAEMLRCIWSKTQDTVSLDASWTYS